MTAGPLIASLRKTKGMSQELLAEEAKISLRTIQRIEAGDTIPRLHTLKSIAMSLGVPVEEFTGPTIEVNTPVNDLKVINLYMLTVVIFPVIHIFIAVSVWRKYHKEMSSAVKRVLSFQILWTITTLLLLYIVPSIQFAFIHSRVIGHFPPTIIIVYVTQLILNLVFILYTSYRLDKGEREVYSFVPALF